MQQTHHTQFIDLRKQNERRARLKLLREERRERNLRIQRVMQVHRERRLRQAG